MKRNQFYIVIVISILSVASIAEGQHLDISPGVDNGQLVTGGYDDADQSFTPGVRVFGYDFGEEILDPYFAEDPGIHSLPASSGGSFPANSSLSFDIQADLLYWTGSGFGAVPSGESLQLEKGSFGVNVGSGETLPKTGLLIGSSDPTGVIHEHLDSFLFGSDGNAVAGDGIEPAIGVYLLEITLKTDAVGILDSDSIWIVYNNGMDEADHDLAIEWVEQNLVPEPASACLLLAGGTLFLRRRRSAE